MSAVKQYLTSKKSSQDRATHMCVTPQGYFALDDGESAVEEFAKLLAQQDGGYVALKEILTGEFAMHFELSIGGGLGRKGGQGGRRFRIGSESGQMVCARSAATGAAT